MTQTDPDNNVKPVDKQHIYNLIETVVKGLSSAQALPVKQDQIDTNAKVDTSKGDNRVDGVGGGKPVGNINPDSKAGQQQPDTKVDQLTNTPGPKEVTQTDPQNESQKTGLNERQTNVLEQLKSDIKASKTAAAPKQQAVNDAKSDLDAAQAKVDENKAETAKLEGKKTIAGKLISKLKAKIEGLKTATAYRKETRIGEKTRQFNRNT